VAAAVEATLIKPTGAMHDLGVGVQQRLRGLDMRGAATADAVHVAYMYMYRCNLRYTRSYTFA
jgi:hypothetical protein